MDNIGNYNLGFISDEDIYNHVKATVEKYRTSINLQEFNDNIVDPIRVLSSWRRQNRHGEKIVAR